MTKWLPRKMKLPQPTWLPELAVRLIILKKTLDNGQKVENAVRIADKALAEVARISLEIESGRRMTEAALNEARERLEMIVTLLEALAGRVSTLEARTVEHDRQLAEHLWRIAGLKTRVFRRGCRVYHAYDWRLGRCTDRR